LSGRVYIYRNKFEIFSREFMDGYTRHEIRKKIIASGGDPDAPPSHRERIFFKYGMPILGVLFWAGLFFVLYKSVFN